MGDIDKSVMQFTQCFMCNGWTPPHLTRAVVLEGNSVTVCLGCYKKLARRIVALEIEAQKLEEELEPEEEITSAFGATAGSSDGRTSPEEPFGSDETVLDE